MVAVLEHRQFGIRANGEKTISVNPHGLHDRLRIPDRDDPAVEIDDIGAILRGERSRQEEKADNGA